MLRDVKRLRWLETVDPCLNIWAVQNCFIQLPEFIVRAVNWAKWDDFQRVR